MTEGVGAGPQAPGARQRGEESWLPQLPGLLTLAWLAPFFLAPLGLLLAYAFATQNYLTGAISFGWTVSAWERANDPLVLGAFGRSVVAAAITTVATAIIGY